jgi:hypothetical protein
MPVSAIAANGISAPSYRSFAGKTASNEVKIFLKKLQIVNALSENILGEI